MDIDNSTTAKVCIVVPCYNEAERLDAGAFATFLMDHPHCDLLFVNDGSTDQTIGVLNVLATANSNASVFDLVTNGGKGEAVRKGMAEAIERDNYDYVGFMDADLATAPKEVFDLHQELAANEHLQLVMGSRWHHLGAKIQRSPKRHYLGRIFATVTTHMTGLDAYDTQCGAKMMRSSRLREVLAEPFETQWLFDLELLCRFQALAPNQPLDSWAMEVPLRAWQDLGDSRLATSDFVKAPVQLAKIRKRYALGGAALATGSKMTEAAKGFAFALVVALIVAVNSGLLIKEPKSQHNTDFQVFQAASVIAERGDNPYEIPTLMEELRRPDASYDETYRTELDWPDKGYFNPPLWFTMLALTGWKAGVFVVGSAFLFGLALWVWRSSVTWPIWFVLPVVAAWDYTLLAYNGRIGQSGYLLGAGIGLSYWYAKKRPVAAGAAGTLLAYKPHVWFAQWIFGWRQKRETAQAQFGWSALLGLVSIAVSGITIWLRYAASLTSSHDIILVGHSMTYASIHDSLANSKAIAIGAVLTAAVTFVLLRSKRLSAQTEWFLLLAGIQIASGHSLWYDWAWLIFVPLAYRWAPAIAAVFWGLYPLAFTLNLFNGPTFITLATLLIVVYLDLKASFVNQPDSSEPPPDTPTEAPSEKKQKAGSPAVRTLVRSET